ncbi:MAG: c-type cytochrome [Bacteroidetes bacterium]|nr:c-type cytochrome [Bacteroidota bacterium]MDA1120245.1 c-type cytochrome [Bacteroidota bacterium]
MPAFEGSSNPEIGSALVDYLTNSPLLDGFSEQGLQSLFDSYSDELKPRIDGLMAKLSEVRGERLQKLTQIEALVGKGDEERGRALYFGKAICSTCHTILDEGGTLGPDLTSVQKDRSIHDIVESIIYPGVSLARDYETYQVKTATETHIGILKEQTPDAVVLETGPQTSVRIARNEIVEISNSETSMMPQGLDQLLSEDEKADLIAFLLGRDLVY